MFDFFSRFQRESGMYISTYMSLTKDFLRLNLLSLTDFPLPSKNMIYWHAGDLVKPTSVTKGNTLEIGLISQIPDPFQFLMSNIQCFHSSE